MCGGLFLIGYSPLGITLQEPVELQVLQDLLMELVEDSCPRQEVVDLVDAAATFEAELATG